MENYKINHELNEYGYNEGSDFIGLMPVVMKSKEIKTLGGSETSVKHFGFDATGSDAMEVVDVQYFMEKVDSRYFFSTYNSSGSTEENGSGTLIVGKTDGSNVGKTPVIIKDYNTEANEGEYSPVPGKKYFVDSEAIPRDDAPLSAPKLGEGKKETDSDSDSAYQLYDYDNGDFIETDIWVRIYNEME